MPPLGGFWSANYKADMAQGKPIVSRPGKVVKKTGAINAGARKNAEAEAARVTEIFARFAAAMPEPKSELEYRDPFTLLVAVVLSAQATDVGVNKATRGLFAHRRHAGEDGRRSAKRASPRRIKTIGLFRTKAKNVIALSQALIREHGGETPQDRDALEALPGVGRKTANVVLNVAFGVPTLAVDTHVFRVANRIPLARGKTPREVEDGLMAIVPARYLEHAHHWLILHGRYVCKARAPLCARCVIADLCRFPDKTA